VERMIKVKKRHIKDARERYFKNKKYLSKGVLIFKNISDEERIEIFAEMLAECEQKMKDFRKKYPKGIVMDIERIKCDMEPIDWGFDKT